ncbi:MAG: GlmU family protein [Flavobacteriales bacterium]
MNLVLFDNAAREHLLPFTFTRPVAAIRIGIFAIAEKWEKVFQTEASYLTQDYLSKKFPLHLDEKEEATFIAGNLLPNAATVEAIQELKPGQALFSNAFLMAFKGTLANLNAKNFETKTYVGALFSLDRLWEIFSKNGSAIDEDLKLLRIRKGVPEHLKATNLWIGDDVYVEEGAKVTASVINSNTGPVYIGKDAEIMEGCTIRGPFALCEHSVLKMGAKVYGPTTIGPYSKAGGEIGNSVIFGYSNKGHEGFLGNSVLGEWCNLGADTNNSNLKNNYGNVKLWNYALNAMENSGLQFCGLMMGDHSKCGINTMFNTGTVVGVSANIYGAGFPPNFIPSFAWGGADGFQTYKPEKAFETAERVFERRNLAFDQEEQDILSKVFELTTKYRTF